MRSLGIPPNSHSFDLIVRACENALDEPAVIYSTLSSLNFPKRYALVAAQRRVARHDSITNCARRGERKEGGDQDEISFHLLTVGTIQETRDELWRKQKATLSEDQQSTASSSSKIDGGVESVCLNSVSDGFISEKMAAELNDFSFVSDIVDSFTSDGQNEEDPSLYPTQDHRLTPIRDLRISRIMGRDPGSSILPPNKDFEVVEEKMDHSKKWNFKSVTMGRRHKPEQLSTIDKYKSQRERKHRQKLREDRVKEEEEEEEKEEENKEVEEEEEEEETVEETKNTEKEDQKKEEEEEENIDNKTNI